MGVGAFAPSDGRREPDPVGDVAALVDALVGAGDEAVEVGAELDVDSVGDVLVVVGASDVELVCGVVSAVVGEVAMVGGGVGVAPLFPVSASATTTAITAARTTTPASHQPHVLRRAGTTAGST